MGQLFESPSQITLTASGVSPRTQLQALKDLSVSATYFMPHASRSFTSSAYFTLTSLQNTSQAYVIIRNGQQLFTSMIMCNPSPDLNAKIHLSNDVGSRFVMTGDEYLMLKDSGSSAAVYIDTLAFYDATFVLKNGAIARVSQ
jgi:hypothetical protein